MQEEGQKTVTENMQISGFVLFNASHHLRLKAGNIGADKHTDTHILLCWKRLPIRGLQGWCSNEAFQSAAVCARLSRGWSGAKRLAICPAIMSGPDVTVQT